MITSNFIDNLMVSMKNNLWKIYFVTPVLLVMEINLDNNFFKTFLLSLSFTPLNFKESGCHFHPKLLTVNS